jgi:hypothetical protein
MTSSNGANSDRSESLNVLTEQIGRLTEVVTVGFQDLKAITERQAQTAERQEQNITRLVGIVEMMRDRQARES